MTSSGPPSFLDGVEALGCDRSLLDTLVADAKFGIYVDHPERGCVFANRALLDQFGIGWTDFAGFGWARHVHPDDAEGLRAAIQEYEHHLGVIDVQYRVRHPDGHEVWIHARVRAIVDDDGRHVGSIGTTEDATEYRAMRSRSGSTQRVELIGRMAGRVAHDFNNLLTVLVLSAGILRGKAPESARPNLDEIDLALEQARQLTDQMLTLSRLRAHGGRTQVDRQLRALERLVRRAAGEGVALDLDLDADGAWVALDPGQLGQVVLNLVQNARDALEGRGRTVVETRQKDGVLTIRVVDDGFGMSAEVRRRALDPLFTTKDVGRGTGLGLVIVKDIVEGVGGHVAIESEPGHGTEVRIDLPVADPPVSAAEQTAGTAADETVRADEPDLRGTQTVLLVEDDDAVRQSLAYALAVNGYSVEAASSLGDALRLADDPDHGFDALVSDILLPDGEGTELGRALRAHRPDLPIVFVSGFPGRAAVDLDTDAQGNTVFLPKPFRSRDLCVALAEVLRQSSASRPRP